MMNNKIKIKSFILIAVIVTVNNFIYALTNYNFDMVSNAIALEISRFVQPGAIINVSVKKITPQIIDKEIKRVEILNIPEIKDKMTLEINLHTKDEILKAKADVGIRVIADVLIASKTISSGSVIHKEDLGCAKKNIAGLNFVPFDCEKAQIFEGKISTKVIQSGKIISSGDFIKESTIKVGDIVLIEIQDGALNITTKGRAEDNGNPGDIIKVRNISSKKLIFCRVLGEGRVTPEVK